MRAYRPREAIAEAATVQVNRAGSITRSCYHHLHSARAYGMLGKDEKAISALTAARAVAHHLVRHDALAREQVRDLVRQKRSPDERLRRLAKDLQVI